MKIKPDWEQVAHELAYAILYLENSNSPQGWRKVFHALNTYEEACLEL